MALPRRQLPLSKRQKAALAIEARKAWEALDPGAPFEDWRRDVQETVTGKRSLTACVQDDYLPLRRAFEERQQAASELDHWNVEEPPQETTGDDQPWPTGEPPAKLWRDPEGPQLRKIGRLLGSSRSWNYAHAIAKRVAKVEHLDWCTQAQLRKVIAALNYNKQRRGKRG